MLEFQNVVSRRLFAVSRRPTTRDQPRRAAILFYPEETF